MTALLLALLAAGPGLRQIETPAEPRQENLIEGEVSHGGYGGPRISYGRLAGYDAVDVGGEGGWILNHHFILGGAGYGLVTNQPAPGQFASSNDLTMGYGGFMIGYTILPQKLVHATFTALVGAGGIGARGHLNSGETDLGDSFFVVEPTATMDLNVAHFLRFGVAVSYRWVTGVQTNGITNADLRGVFGSMILKFGRF